MRFHAHCYSDKHSRPEDDKLSMFKKCAHKERDDRGTESEPLRLDPASPAYSALVRVLENKILVKTLGKVSHNLHTSVVESYNNVR